MPDNTNISPLLVRVNNAQGATSAALPSDVVMAGFRDPDNKIAFAEVDANGSLNVNMTAGTFTSAMSPSNPKKSSKQNTSLAYNTPTVIDPGATFAVASGKTGKLVFFTGASAFGPMKFEIGQYDGVTFTNLEGTNSATIVYSSPAMNTITREFLYGAYTITGNASKRFAAKVTNLDVTQTTSTELDIFFDWDEV